MTEAPNDIQQQNDAHPKTSPIDCDGVLLTDVQYHMVPISILWYREYWTIQLKVQLKPDLKQEQFKIIQYTNMATPTFDIYVS